MDNAFKIVEIVIAILVCYIGIKQTKKYREDDEKEELKAKLEESHRDELAKSMQAIRDTLKTTQDNIFFMFDNHGHEILCENEDCIKPRTGKVFISPPQQAR